jgi:hypothetical protein
MRVVTWSNGRTEVSENGLLKGVSNGIDHPGMTELVGELPARIGTVEPTFVESPLPSCSSPA